MYPGSYYSHTNPNPMPYAYYYAPNDNDPKLKDQPSHMKIDHNHIPLNSPYQPWPYDPNYPAPLDYHGCCNPTHFYGGPYGFRHPYPNYRLPPPPPSLHSHGFYPFPGVYSIPPPHYSVEQPKYDYDKHNHCCGCKHQEHEKKPNIEREAQEVDKKTSESLVPYLLKDCPYPIMWVPPGYMNTGSKATEKDKDSHEPVSLKTLEPVKRVENREIDRDQQNEDSGDRDRFPFPLFWLPSEKKDSGNEIKEKNVDLVARNGLNDEKKKQRKINDETETETKSETSGKHVVQKVIPVKQVGPEEEKKIPKRVETKAKFDSVLNTECKSSPKSSSKLPPVCLRIDPLPRKKKTSRSPSPPGDKDRSKDSSMNDLKKSSQQTSEESKKNSEDGNKGNIKTIEVTNATNEVEKDYVSATKGDESQKGGVQGQLSEGEICEVKERKKLSEREAALIIQSVYRGFEVRKSQPLMKLRQISEVKRQVVELRNRIQDLESSFTNGVDEKQKLIIGETIMSILLKLDTIQGLHPIVRDVRKSVAKELVGLQEKLDSLTFVKPEPSIDENLTSAEQVVHSEDDFVKDDDVKVTASDLNLCDHQIHDTNPYDEESEQPVIEAVEEKFDQVLNQSESMNGVELTDVYNDGAVQARDIKFVEQNNGDLVNDAFDQASNQSESMNRVELMDFVDVHDIKLLEQNKGELNNNQVQMFGLPVETEESRSDICANHHEVETADLKDDVGIEPVIDLKPLVELESQPSVTDSQLKNLEDEIQDHQDKMDHTDVIFKADVENVDSCDNANIEEHDRDAIMADTKADLSKEAIQEDFVVSTEDEAPKADDVDSSTDIVTDDVQSVSVTSGDDKRLMEENEKLRSAMEEMMKAGNQQLSVIKELTGRVKDLEKKLSRRRNKKKVKLNKCSGTRRIQEELRDCSV